MKTLPHDCDSNQPCRLCGRWPGVPPCAHRGTERQLVHGSNRDWRTCSHPAQPLGLLVCVCKGCGPTCPGYVATPETT